LNEPGGTVNITAIQYGDDNWDEAVLVQRNIRVLDADSAFLLSLHIASDGGTLTPAFSPDVTEYTLSLSCGITRLSLRYDERDTAVLEGGASFDGDSLVVIEESPLYKEIAVTVTSLQNVDLHHTYTIKLVVPLSNESLWWNENLPNKLEVINRPDLIANQESKFLRYEWYVDSATTPASTSGIYYSRHGVGGHTYRVRVSYDSEGDDNWVEICPLTQPVVTEYSKLSVYPNPAGGEVTVRYMSTSASDNSEIKIYHLSTGSQAAIYPVGRQTEGENNVMLDVSSLPAGAYLVKRGDEAVVMVKK
jgi:hypothetical protein